MKATSIGLCLSLFLALVPAARRSSAAPMGTAFTYQGQLKDGGLPADGVYDLQFKLFDAATAGAQVGSTLAKGDVAVAGGLFVVSLDFGAAPFAGQARFLEIGVRPGASTGAYTLLGARQELTPSPNALHSSTTSDPAVQRRTVAPNCTVGQYIRSIAADGTPTCAPDTNGGGTVTSVATGAGLTGGTITGSGTIAVAPGGISSAMIAGGAAVKSLNGVADTVTIAGSGGASVSTVGNTITVAAATLPTDCTAPGTVVMGPAGDTTLIGAGYTQAGGTLSQVWTGTTTAGAPTPRTDHTAIWTGSKMIVWGGYNGSIYLNDGGQYDPVTNSWTPVPNTLGTPPPRSLHTAIWTGSRMIIWGGNNATTYHNTGAQYDPVANSWTATATSAGVPSGRSWHTAVWTGSKMIVWGGFGPLNSGGVYDPASNTWIATATTVGVPNPRYGHTAVWTGSRMIVWGGFNGGSYPADAAAFDPSANSWTVISAVGAPIPRSFHSAVWTGSQVIVWGGYTFSGGGYLDTGGRYDAVGNSWLATAVTAGTPPGRSNHTAVWTGSEMLIWGGRAATPFNTGSRYDPTVDSWLPTPTAGAPGSRYSHAAVWTGSRMIVWGGFSSGQSLNTGGQWFELAYFIKN